MVIHPVISVNQILVFISLEIIRISHVQFALPYFFGYKTDFFSFQNNPKDLDPSC